MELGSIGNQSASLFSQIKTQLNSIGVLQRSGRSGTSAPFTPLPRLVEPSASQSPTPASQDSATSSTISALSIEIKLLNVSITSASSPSSSSGSGSGSGSKQETAHSEQLDNVRHELKLLRAQVKQSLKQELGEVWEQLPSESRGEVRGLFKQFTREVRQAFRDAREQTSEDQALDLEALTQQLSSLFDQFVSDLKQTLASVEQVQAERVDALSSQLTSLFEGLIGRLAPPQPAPEPQVEPVEPPAAETPEASPETTPTPTPTQPEPVRAPREGSLAYQTISVISISASFQSFSIRA